MNSLSRTVGAGLILTMLFGALAAGQVKMDSLPEGRHILYQAKVVGRNLPKTAREEILAWARRWDSLDHQAREDLERTLFCLSELSAEELQSHFGPIEKESESKRRALVKKKFSALSVQASPAEDGGNPAVVVVIFGSGIAHQIGFGDRSQKNWPRIAHEIMPYGVFLSGLTSSYFALNQRPNWIGELLTGRKFGGCVPDSSVYKFTYPTLFHYFRKLSLQPQGKAWMITMGDRDNIIFDHLPLQKPLWASFKPISLTGVHLRRYDTSLRDVFLSELRSVKDPLKVQASLRKILTPGKLRLDTDFDDVDAQKLIRDVIASRGGNSCDTNAFVMETAVQLLQSDINPELVVVRFGPDWRFLEKMKAKKRKELMAQKMRDDDEAVYSVWKAFRGNAYFRRKGYFIVLAEGHPGGIFIGPDLKKNSVESKKLSIKDVFPLVARMLFPKSWKDFGKGFVTKKSENIIKILFP